MEGDRHSKIVHQDIISDPDAKAHKEVENGFRQHAMAMDVVREYIHDAERNFRLRRGLILELNFICLDGINAFAGTFRNAEITIEGSEHNPPGAFQVVDFVNEMCDYVNDNWNKKTAVHLAAYLLWRLNWIHPFVDGNGRTSRIVSYMVMCIHLNSILPGKLTIPDQISRNKSTYYEGLESADTAFEATGHLDLSDLERYLTSLLASQLVDTMAEASGRDIKLEPH